MESRSSSPINEETYSSTETNDIERESWINEKFDSLLPQIQELWPGMAKNTLESTRGSLDELAKVISEHSGKASYGIREQLEVLFNSASDKTKYFAENLEPLEKQLESLLDDLNSTLRPRIEKPVRERPILAIGIATTLGVLLGIIISGGKKSS